MSPMHTGNGRTLVLFLAVIIVLNLTTSNSFACSLVARPDVVTKPSFMLEMQIDRQVTDVATLQNDISQAFKFVKNVALDTSDTVRYNKDIPYYAEAIWSRGKGNYDLFIYYFDNDKPLQRTAGINTEHIKSIKINMVSWHVVYLGGDCSVSPAPDRFISIINSLESPAINSIVDGINGNERVKSVSLEMIDDVTGKLTVNYESASKEEILFGQYVEPSISSTSYEANPLILIPALLLSNIPYVLALILVGGIIALVIYIKRSITLLIQRTIIWKTNTDKIF